MVVKHDKYESLVSIQTHKLMQCNVSLSVPVSVSVLAFVSIRTTQHPENALDFLTK